jgi:hypothetical protein
MNDTAYSQQSAIRQRRDQQYRVQGWALFSCPTANCPVQEVNAYVSEEDIDAKPFQAPNRCPRCQAVLVWEGWGK